MTTAFSARRTLSSDSMARVDGIHSPGLNVTESPSTPAARSRRNSSTPFGGHYNIGSMRSRKIESGRRVRVTVRLRPRNTRELIMDSDFSECIDFQPELRRLKLHRNDWDCETYRFDEVFHDTASQKQIYKLAAKPVVESVLEGYNGTILAYGQTGTGKTFTLGSLGKEDASDRGVMVRAMEDILADLSSEQDSVSVSYLQLYMEALQDLLVPERNNIAIVEDPMTGDVSLPGATLVEVRNQKSFLDLLETGEANRSAANSRLSADASRSHAILLVKVQKSVKMKRDRELAALNGNGIDMQLSKEQHMQMVRNNKLLIIDLAGSEMIDESASDDYKLKESMYINNSLTALGKCISAFAENSSDIPCKDSKLTRLLQDCFGGGAKVSLILTIGSSHQHQAETANTIMFGQRAMNLENTVKLKEGFDYKGLCQRLETDLDRLIAENERQNKAVHDAKEEMKKYLEDARNLVMEAENKLAISLQEMTAEKLKIQKQHLETFHELEQERDHRKGLEKELANITQTFQTREELDQTIEKLDTERFYSEALEKRLLKVSRSRTKQEVKEEVGNEDILEENGQLEEQYQLKEQAEIEHQDLQFQVGNEEILEANGQLEEQYQLNEQAEREHQDLHFQAEAMSKLSQSLEEQLKEKEMAQVEIENMQHHLNQETTEATKLDRDIVVGTLEEPENDMNKFSHIKDAVSTVDKLLEQVGLQKILSLLESENNDVQIHAVKVVANLAAQEVHQQKIVEAGGLGLLLTLLQSSEDETIQRVSAGAIANLAMKETNQELIMSLGGVKLLAKIANDAEDPQTMRIVAGALANLCGNVLLQGKLQEEGGIRALLGMIRSQHPDVLTQVARGIANFAKCESRGFRQGHKIDRSQLIGDGVLPWIVANANSEVSPIRRHLELAICHLAQHEVNAKDLISAGAFRELACISKNCSWEDIKRFAKRTISASTTFQTELRQMQLA